MEDRTSDEPQVWWNTFGDLAPTRRYLTTYLLHDGENRTANSLTGQPHLDGKVNDMDALALDPADYDGTYKLVGGRLAFDFVNTVSWPQTPRRHDWLDTPGNVVTWLRAVGLGHDVAIGTNDLPTIHQLRTVVADAIRPLAHGATPPPSAIEQLNVVLTEIAPSRVIDPRSLAWRWASAASTTDLFRPVVADAANIITSTRTDRFKHCPSCDWIFEDQTRNGKRRWCDMADCGSRAKSRDYYQRTREAT